MKIISSITEMQKYSEDARLQNKSIGMVPTMGYLHEGHLSLVSLAKQSCDVIITSIFVNPAQFAPNEDFEKYPRDIERDTALAKAAGTAVLFTPDARSMYPEGFGTYVGVDPLSSILEGKFRPTHFRGVTTVVSKLFLITKPHKAFFGQKDAQQCVVIKRMVSDLNFDIEIVIGPIIREDDGLAKSSRNVYLSPQERQDATILSQSLQHAQGLVANGEREALRIKTEVTRMIQSKSTTSIDYVAVVNAETLADLQKLESGTPALVALAVRVGSTRLIDNTLVTPN